MFVGVGSTCTHDQIDKESVEHSSVKFDLCNGRMQRFILCGLLLSYLLMTDSHLIRWMKLYTPAAPQGISGNRSLKISKQRSEFSRQLTSATLSRPISRQMDSKSKIPNN